MKLLKLSLVAAVLCCTAVMSYAQQDMPLPVDTAFHTGKLDNGLTYYVRHNNYPENRVNFYIAQRVGSIQEEESQRGLAHFLEHMAFNGTENFHGEGKGILDYTRSLGVEFGSDLNAYTSIDQTVYRICDVPSTRQSALDSCLLILKDWSNGLLLEDEEIDKERGVIHEEWRLRLTPTQRMYERNLETLYPGSKYGRRMPIGLMDVVDNFKYQELRDYYHKWYRPDNQAIIVVGDIDVDYTINKINELFAGIKVDPNAAQVVPEEVPDNAEPIVVVDKDKEQQYSIAQVMFKHDVFPDEMKGGMLYMMFDYMRYMASSMLNKRLSEKAQDPDCPFAQAFAYDGEYALSRTKDAFTMSVMPKEGRTAEAVNAVMVEAIRAAKHGFTATEFVRAKDEYMSQLEKQYNNRDKISNNRFGDMCRDNYLENEPLVSIETEYQMMQQFAPMIPVEAINQILPQLVSENDSNLVIMNFNQEKEDAVYPANDELLAAIDNARSADIEAYVDNVKDEPLMTIMPKAGKIKKETKNDKFGYTKLELSNGATVILKKTDYKADEIRMSAESKGGSSLYGKEDYANIASILGQISIFDAVVGSSGLGNFDNTQLEKALAGKQANVDFSLGTSYERMSGNSTVKDCETMFQLLYLYMTDIRKDEKATNALWAQIEPILKNKSLNPDIVFMDSVNSTWSNHVWRDRPFDADDIKNVNVDRIMQIVKERTANAADWTFYFVGNFDETLIRQYICQYIASLPKKGKAENFKNVIEHPVGQCINQFTNKSETPKANARMYWYTKSAPYTLENSIKADITGLILEMIYLQRIREDEGAAYSANAGGYQRFEGDNVITCIVGVCPMQPEKKDIAIDLMRNGIQEMAKEINPDYLAKVKEVLMKRADTNAKENAYWMGVINMLESKGIDTHSDYKNIVSAITPEDIAAFVRDRILADGNHTEVIMLPAE